ncbi:MAG: hypothetical protein AAF511_11810 [Pseudomonadota bacterium]
MPLLRFIAIALGLSLIIGEAYRSWGAGRPVMFWMDDMIMGSMLIAAAIMVAKDTFNRRAFFTAAWGTNAGMLYGSFFGKVFAPANANSGNFDLGFLTILIGIAFATAVAGMIASIVLQRGNTTN